MRFAGEEIPPEHRIAQHTCQSYAQKRSGVVFLDSWPIIFLLVVNKIALFRYRRYGDSLLLLELVNATTAPP
jgi:hypothetical protein